MKTHTEIRNDLADYIDSLSLTPISGAITVESVFAPEQQLEKSKGTSIQVFILSSSIAKEDRREDARTRTARCLIRHRLVAESLIDRAAEEVAYETLVGTLEKHLVRYVSADEECKATTAETPVLLEAEQYYQEGVLSSLIDVDVLNYEQSVN